MDHNNKVPTELDEFLPTDGSNFKDGVLTAKYKVQVTPKDAKDSEVGLTGKEFDPFAERRHPNPTTNGETLTHLLKASLGTGILAMPCAFRSSGLIVGIFATIFVAFVCTHCSYILVKCAHVLYHKTRKTEMSFADVAEASLAHGPKRLRWLSKFARYVIQISLFVTYFGTCSVYAVIIAANFREVLNHYIHPPLSGDAIVLTTLNHTTVDGTNTTLLDAFNQTTVGNLTMLTAMNTTIGNSTLLAVFNRTISGKQEILAALNRTFVQKSTSLTAVNSTVTINSALLTAVNSTIAKDPKLLDIFDVATKPFQPVLDSIDERMTIACLLIPLILLTWVPDLKYLAPVSMIANVFMGTGLAITFWYLCTDLPGLNEVFFYRDISYFPKFFSLTVFAMEAIGVVMPLENQMKTPQNFVGVTGVLSKGMSGVTIVYILLGVMGYLRYPGERNHDTITEDLPIKEIPAQIVKIAVGLAVFCTFGLQFFVCLDIAWNGMKERFQKKPVLANYVARTLLVTGCVLLAVAVPTIGPLIGLIGAFCFSILGILIPVALEMITYWDVGFGKFNWMIYKNVFYVFIGIMALIFGSKDAIESIVKKFF